MRFASHRKKCLIAESNNAEKKLHSHTKHTLLPTSYTVVKTRHTIDISAFREGKAHTQVTSKHKVNIGIWSLE